MKLSFCTKLDALERGSGSAGARRTSFTEVMTTLAIGILALSQLLWAGLSVADDDQPVAQEPVLEQVVVTANKRTENVQNVPDSVSVESGEQLIQRGQEQLADYADYVPGFNVFSSGTPGQTTVSLRGISSTTSTSAIAAYLDDTPIGSSAGWANGASTLLDMLPYDLDRLEVLRGPQGTLYGAGAMGGLIKYVLKAPSTTETEANLGGDAITIDGAGNLGYSLRARVSVPVISDTLGISLSVFDKMTPGFITNAYSGERDTNQDWQYGARLAALWTPLSNLSVKVSALTQDIEANDSAVKQFASATQVPTTDGALVLAPTDPRPDLTEDLAFLSPYEQRIDYFSSTVDWNLDLFDVVSATSWSSLKSFSTSDYTYGYGGILQELGGSGPGLVEYVSSIGVNKFTQEFRLVSPTGKTIEWLAGVFDSHESTYQTNSIRAFNLNYTPVSGALAFPPGLITVMQPEVYDEYAAFADLTWNLTDAFSITGGARYAENHQDIDFYIPLSAIWPGPVYTHIGTQQGVFTWMGTAQYHFNKDTMVYVRAATGYRPGGPNSPLPGVPLSYGADSLINYELGVKSTFFDGKALVDLSVYHIDWKDIQLLSFTPIGYSYFANGGKDADQGVELASQYSPVRGLTFGLNAAYADSHLTSVLPTANYLLTGFQLPSVPKESGSLTADYEWALTDRWEARFGVAYRYVGWQWLSIVESKFSPLSGPTVQAPSYSVFDLNASLQQNHITFKLYARNLTNNRAITGPSVAGEGLITTNIATGASEINTTFLQPRTIGFGVDYAF